jgi:hypothetical protein
MSRSRLLVSTRLEPTGGMRNAARLAMRVWSIEWLVAPGAMTRAFGLPRVLLTAPLTIPARESGVVKRASHEPSAEPPGWWHWEQLAWR